MDIISTEEIKATKAYEKLIPSIKGIILKRVNREVINNALIVYKNTGYFNSTIGNKNVEILKELIEKYNSKK